MNRARSTVKDMRSGERGPVSREEVAKDVGEKCGLRPYGTSILPGPTKPTNSVVG